MQAELTRSDVLRPLVWPILAVILALAVLSGRAPTWLITALSWMLAVLVALYAITYIICFFIDRDALRSEKYKLQKMAIERGVFGDSAHGLVEVEANVIALPGSDAAKPVEPQ